jgi:hypothetical protein
MGADDITKQAIRAAGGPSKVAAAIIDAGGKITSQAVSQWPRVPDVHVRLLEKLCGRAYTRYQMRPDIFGEGPDQVEIVGAQERAA